MLDRTLFISVLFLWLGACSNDSSTQSLPKWERLNTFTDGFSHPTEVVRTSEGFIVAQMHSRWPLIKLELGEVSESEPTAAVPKSVPVEGLRSPHFIAEAQDGFYVSDGRASDVWYFDYNNLKDYNDPKRGRIISTGFDLNRPHGLCLDSQGWLYIADSVNSRLIRWHTKNKNIEVFADHQKRIAYGRQLLCRDDGLWLSNSYEGAFDLNPGQGGVVLKISDFSSGNSEVIFADPSTNFTGIAIINDRILLVGRWSGKFDIAQLDMTNFTLLEPLMTYDDALDAPYGMYNDEENRKLYISFLGLGKNREQGERGGVVEFSY